MKMVIHTVKAGETLYSIAKRYQVELRRLMSDNGLENTNLVVGQTLVVLFPSEIHVVQVGESLFSIAEATGVTINRLFRNNPWLGGNSTIISGEELVISYWQEELRETEINGYAYPFIDLSLLRSTLPFLTYLMPFTYEITDNGELSEPDDEKLIALAGEYGVIPLMNLSNLREPKGFNSELAHNILTNHDMQTNIIDETYEIIIEKGYGGVDVDFEYIYEEDKYRFAEFIRKLSDKLHPMGYLVFVALAAKTSTNQTGLLVAGHDYSAMGEAADGVLLMTYEWGYRYGEPMAISPIGNMREVLDYAVTQMPPDKIFLGLPNYGYDWPLPVVNGVTAAKSISNVEAVRLARDYGVEILYSNTAQAAYFQYTTGEVLHEVWFDDARSIRAKLALVAEYGLRGGGYWNLMRPFPENWSVLNALYKIAQL